MKQKRYPIAKLMLFIAATTLLFLLACQTEDIVEGVVDHKAVTGIQDDTTYTILLNRPGDGTPWILVKDKDYDDYFATEDENAIISESLEQYIREKYSEVNYWVNVRLPSTGEGTQPYRASREIFNKMKVDSKVRFETSGPAELPEIIRVLENADQEG